MKLKLQKSQLNAQAGFTLMETIIAIVIVILVLVLYQASVNTILLSRHSRNDETALRIASIKVEELRNAGYASVPSSGSFTSPLLSDLPSGTASLVSSDFNDKAKEVVVTVSWQEPQSGTTKSVTMTTVIANTGGL